MRGAVGVKIAVLRKGRANLMLIWAAAHARRSPLIEDEIFKPLLNDSLFKSVKADKHGYGISWTDELDLSESELWLNGVMAEQQNSV